jgi:hypothetical protein
MNQNKLKLLSKFYKTKIENIKKNKLGILKNFGDNNNSAYAVIHIFEKNSIKCFERYIYLII